MKFYKVFQISKILTNDKQVRLLMAKPLRPMAHHIGVKVKLGLRRISDIEARFHVVSPIITREEAVHCIACW